MDDIEPENDTFYCSDCEEEYWLPEDTEKCPICNYDNIYSGGNFPPSYEAP